MSSIEKIQHSIQADMKRLTDRIDESLTSSNELMNTVIRGYMKTKGKMLRPMLVILTARLFGPVTDKAIAAGASVEMLHNASLIHDDVVDDSQMRRSQPTINNLWGNHMAVLVGDFFVSNALLQATDTGDPRIVATLGSLGKLLSVGEVDQIYNARNHILDERAYFQIISRKTASLFVSCVKMGAYAADVDDDRVDRLCRFAELLGLSFQIRDDVFDYYADPKIGKPTGNDLREGKITLPLLYALGQEKADRVEEMRQLAAQGTLSTDEIHTLIEFAKANGGIEYAYQTMERFERQALESLEGFEQSDALESLKALFPYVIRRDK